MLYLLYDPQHRYLAPVAYKYDKILYNGRRYMCDYVYYNKKLSKTSVLGKKYKMTIVVCGIELWLCDC